MVGRNDFYKSALFLSLFSPFPFSSLPLWAEQCGSTTHFHRAVLLHHSFSDKARGCGLNYLKSWNKGNCSFFIGLVVTQSLVAKHLSFLKTVFSVIERWGTKGCALHSPQDVVLNAIAPQANDQLSIILGMNGPPHCRVLHPPNS